MELRQKSLNKGITLSPSKFCFDKKSDEIRNIIIHLSKYISEMEMWDRVFPEMIDDAIF